MKNTNTTTHCIITGMVSSFLLFFIVALCASQNPIQPQDPTLLQVPQQVTLYFAEEEIVAPTPVLLGEKDNATPLTLARSDGTVETLSLSAYLWGVLAAEMPASFPLEALKAQAVAARTYTLLRMEHPSSKHGEAQVCDNSGCCQAYMDVSTRLDSWGENGAFYQEKLALAVAETDGLSVLYEGYPIDAVFFSSADGTTLDAFSVWGTALPYLVGVETREGDDVPNYHSVVTYTCDELQLLLTSAYPTMQLPSDTSQWFTNRISLEGGSVAQYTVGGVTLTGQQLRTALGLRSTSFSLTSGEVFTFFVTGYGHGVGLSQYGAKAMAEDGATFEEIITWYYSNTTLDVWTPTL